ncbi:hypothetical protein F5887DRAFT_1075274 [Amanita rubescens]|nr:hypothetical protein F5887DRAFT_1080590 [Amanita rubescens]KAF8344668.1 hypothetical protein F5887DRAFT_1075274 [Amanita rubescens]
MSVLSLPFNLKERILSFLRIEDIWSLQMTCHSNRASAQDYLKNKFHYYLAQVLDNTSGGSAEMLSRFLEISDAIIVGPFCWAMMADEDDGLNWSFDSLQIIVPRDSATLLEECFDRSSDEWSDRNPLIDNAPSASLPKVLDFNTSNLNLTVSPGRRNRGVLIFVCDRDSVMKCCAEVAPSTAYASFVMPSALFCAYPDLTFRQQKTGCCYEPFPILSVSLLAYAIPVQNASYKWLLGPTL